MIFRMSAALTPASQNLERFRLIVLEECELLAELRQTADLDAFVALAVRKGLERGCEFTGQDVRAALRESRRVWLERWI